MKTSTPTLGELLIASGVMSPGQVIECLEIQERGRYAGRLTSRLGAIAIERGYLGASELEETVRQQTRLAHAQAGEPEETRRPPDLTQEFRILRGLGGDSASRVCLARHAKTGALVSLRLFNLGSRSHGTPQAEVALARVRSALSLRHRAIPAAVGGGRIGSEIFFAADYIEGTSLRRLIEEGGALPWRWCWEMAVSLASALSHVHERGDLHLEIRPSNVLVGRDGSAHLAGAGAPASPIQNVRWLLEARGTVPVYLAPEEREGIGPPDARADVYALGATLYHAATGVPPCVLRSPDELSRSAAAGPPPDVSDLNPELPPTFARLLGRMLSHRPSDRLASAAECEGELARMRPRSGVEHRAGDWRRRIEACLAAGPPAPPESPAKRPSLPDVRVERPPRRIGAALLPAAVAVAVLLSVTFLYRSTFAYRIFLLRGEELYVRGDRRGALAKFLKSQSLRPDVPGVQDRILSLALETRDYPLASRQAETIRGLQPGREKELYLLAADLEMWSGGFPAALRSYRKFRDAYGDGLEIRLRIAHAEAACNNLEEALGRFTAISRDFPADGRALLEMARLSAALGRWEDSLRFYAATLRGGAESETVLGEYAHTLEACRAFAAAAQVYARLSVKGGSGTALARARCLFWDGQFEEARQALTALLRAPGPAPEARMLLAQSYEALEERELAEAAWRDLVSLVPDRLELWLELGRFYERWGKRDRAIAHLHTALRTFGAVPEVTSFLGRLHAARGEAREAAEFYRQSVGIVPTNVDDRVELARMLSWSHRFAEALEVLDGAPGAIQSSPRIDLERAKIFAHLGRKKEARETVRRLEFQAGGDAATVRILCEIDLEVGEPGEARLFERWLAERPDDLGATRRFAELLRAGGDHARSWPLYRSLSEREPQNVGLLAEASQEACWAGDPEAGLRLLDRLRDVLKSAGPQAREAAPDREQILRRMIAAAFQARRYPRAEECFVELRGAGVPFTLEDHLLRAKALELSGRTPEAFETLSPLLPGSPSRVDLHAEAAQLAVQLKRFGAAAPLYGRLSELEPGSSRWPIARIQALLWSGDVAGVEAALRDLASRHPEWRDRELKKVEAELRLRTEEYAAAAALIGELRETGPSSETLDREWIRAKSRAGAPEEARPALVELRARRPHDPSVLVLEGDVAFTERRFDEAVRSYREAMVRGDAGRETRLRLARALAQAGRVGEATEMYEALFREEPRDSTPLRDKARLLGWKGEPRASLREYDRLISSFPDVPAFRLERDAKAALFAGDHATAKSAYEILLRAEPGNLQARYDLAEMCRQDDRWEEGRKAYQSIQEAEPSNREAPEALRRLNDRRDSLESDLHSTYLQEESRERKTDVTMIAYGARFERWLSDRLRIRGSAESEDYGFQNGPSVQAYKGMGYFDYLDRPGWTASLGVGYRQYSMSVKDEVLLDARLGYRPEGGLGVEAFVLRDAYTRNVGTIFEDLYFIQEGIELRYRACPGLEFGALGALGTLTDGNQYLIVEGRARYTLLEGESPLYVGYRARRDGFRQEEDLYFSPHNLILQAVGLSWHLSLGGGDPRPRYVEPGYEIVFDSNGQTGHLLSLGFRHPLSGAIQVGADLKATVGTQYDDKHGSVFLSFTF